MALDEEIINVIGGDTSGVTIALLRTIPDCVKLLNKAGRISFMSENGTCSMDIADPKSVIGALWWDLWPEEHRQPLKEAFERALSGQVSLYWGSCPTRAGVDKEWDIRIAPVWDEQDEGVVSVIAISREVAA